MYPVLSWTAGTRHWSAEELNAIKRVQLCMTRRTCHLWPQPQEDWAQYLRRTARWAERMWTQASIPYSGGHAIVAMGGACCEVPVRRQDALSERGSRLERHMVKTRSRPRTRLPEENVAGNGSIGDTSSSGKKAGRGLPEGGLGTRDGDVLARSSRTAANGISFFKQNGGSRLRRQAASLSRPLDSFERRLLNPPSPRRTHGYMHSVFFAAAGASCCPCIGRPHLRRYGRVAFAVQAWHGHAALSPETIAGLVLSLRDAKRWQLVQHLSANALQGGPWRHPARNRGRLSAAPRLSD